MERQRYSWPESTFGAAKMSEKEIIPSALFDASSKAPQTLLLCEQKFRMDQMQFGHINYQFCLYSVSELACKNRKTS